MPFHAVPGRVSRRRLKAYSAALAATPWYIRAYVATCNILSIDPDDWTALPVSEGTVSVEGVVVPVGAFVPSVVCRAGPVDCHCLGKGGPEACKALNSHFSRLACRTASTGYACYCYDYGQRECAARYVEAIHTARVGAFRIQDFDNSPQQHAILNRHLLDYFRDRNRSQETTPYAIPTSQLHLLHDLGMESPQPDAPVVPHGLHKSIEEAQLSRMRNYLPANDYNLICVKDSKVGRLPMPSSRQNPLIQAKDVSRFPGSAIRTSDLSVSRTHFMHDVASEVTPHELVEKLVAENPEAHLFVTGMNPAEVLDRASSFEPSSHHIYYEGGDFNYVFAGSASESYFTPIEVTVAWLLTSSIVASNGRVYHVVLLDDKLGHCLYHIFCGDVEAQTTRTFSTGSMVRLPPALTGTLHAEYVPARLLTAALDFVARTPDLSTRNLSAKVTMVANVVNPKTTARERWVVWHCMALLAPFKTWDWWVRKTFWSALYALSFQWHMFAPVPDIYRYLDERERFMVVHPTESGGWSPRVNDSYTLKSIPNNPTPLQRLSAFTASAFVFLWPKLLFGEVLSYVFTHTLLWDAGERLVSWVDIRPVRMLLTTAIVATAAVVPGHITSYFVRMSGHFWRQLWLPGYVRSLACRIIVELSGAPGARWLVGSPGRGWAWQALLWAVALHSVFPGLVPALVVPWVAYTHGWAWLMNIWLGLVLLENATTWRDKPIFTLGESSTTTRHVRTWNWPAVVAGRLSKRHMLFRYTKTRNTMPNTRTIRVRGPYAGRPYATHAIPVPRFGHTVDANFSGLNSVANLALVTIANAIPTYTASGGKWYLARLVFWDVFDALRFAGYWAAWSVNTLHRAAYCFQRRLGNCGRVPMLQPLPPREVKAVRRRNIDRVLPTVVVQPNAPVAPVGVQLAIPPDGLNFPDWLQQVQTAYALNPNTQPQLTPGQDCFWQALSSLGGTPHMWFCWFSAFMRRPVPANTAVVGTVTIIDMHLFAAVSGIGVRLCGVTEEATLSREARPSLTLQLSHVPLSQDLHVELAVTPVASDGVQSLARVLRTIQAWYPNWANQFIAALQAAPADSVPIPTATLRAIAGAHALPSTMDDIADAVLASFTATPFAMNNGEGYTLAQNGALGAGDSLFEYKAPVSRLRVARTTPAAHWDKLSKRKVGATPRQSADNAARNNVRPEPAMWMSLANELRAKVADYATGHLPAVGLVEEVVSFTADVDRASRLVSDLKAHPSVLGSKADAKWLQSLDSVLDLYRVENRSVTVPVRAYFGVSGCGKTTATAKYLANLTPDLRQMARVVSHTESLRAQTKLALDFPEMRGFNFPTIPGLLAEPTTGPIVFDDAGKFYGGILDLVVLCNPLVPEVVVNGDPAQAASKFPVGGTQSEFDKGPLVVSELTTNYATISHRMFTLLAQTFGVHTTNPRRGHITHSVGGKQGLPVTTASPRYVQVLSSAGRQAYTHDSIQGEDFKVDVEVDMSALEEAVSDRTTYVALTRSSTGVYLHMNAADPRSVIKAPPTGSDLLNAILYSMRADNLPTLLNGNDLTRAVFYSHLHTCMPNLKWFSKVGATLGADAYRHAVDATNATQVAEGSVSDHAAQDHVVSSAAFSDTVIHETHWADKEAREVGFAGLQTDQFKDVSFVNPHVHKRADHATYRLTVDKRITNATPAANYTRKQKCPRTDMIDAFDKMVPVLPLWSPEKHSHYMDRARLEYESGRSASAVEAKLRQHDPERTGKDVVNSLKAQVIKKDEKRGKFEAIPGQLIYEYDISQTLLDAAYSLFLEEEVFPCFPSNYLFYRRMDPSTFISEYQKRWRVGNGVHTSDITRWDVGCDAGVLNFDEHVFSRCGFPRDYIDAYVERRLSTRSQHGQLQTGQPSGDRFTWTLNSMRRAVVAQIVLRVQPDDTVAINGDDEAMDRCADALPFPDTVWAFKDQNGTTGEFSGFELGGPTPVYSARGIHYRTMILVSRDPSAKEKWVNYLSLLSHADCHTWEALDVARLAHTHLSADLFSKSLPVALRAHFPNISFE